MLFSVNYDKSSKSTVRRRMIEDQSYTPGFKNLVSKVSPVSRVSRGKETTKFTQNQLNIYESFKNFSDDRTSVQEKSRDPDYTFSSYTDGRKSAVKQRLNRSQSYADANEDNILIQTTTVIKNRKYIADEDRTIKLKEKLALKKTIMKDKIKRKAILLQKRHEKEKETVNQLYGTSKSGSTYDISRKSRLEAMNNNGLLQRLSNNRASIREIEKFIEQDQQQSKVIHSNQGKPPYKAREKVSRYL